MSRSNASPWEEPPLRAVIFEMLLLLNDEDRHGYGLMQDLKSGPRGRWVLGPGTLYRTLNEMLDKGWITPSETPEVKVSGKVRRYYSITPQGKARAATEARRMAELVRAASIGRLI